MTTAELQKALDQIYVPRDYYSINKGGLPNEKLCIVNDGGWCVYYSERGHKAGLKYFETESAACEYFYNKMKKYSIYYGTL